MRIVIIHQDLFFQGGQKVAAKLANGLAGRGHKVDVVVSKVHSDILATRLDAKPFQLSGEVGFHVLPHRRAAFNVLALASLLRRLKPDVVVPNVGHYNQCAVLAKAVAGLHVPIVYVEHCDTCFGRSPRKTIRFRLRRWFLKRDRVVVAVCDRMRTGLISRYGLPQKKVMRIYNPIFKDSETHEEQKDHVHPWLREKKSYSVVAVGALHAVKNFGMIIDAFEMFHRHVTESRLLIFGRGSLHDALEQRISKKGLSSCATLAGYTDHIVQNLRYADLFLSGSNQETFGIAIAEALNAGLPVVATDCPIGPSEILHQGRLGQLVPVNDSEAMAAAMLRLVRGEWTAAEKFDATEYLESTAIDKYEKLLKEVTGK